MVDEMAALKSGDQYHLGDIPSLVGKRKKKDPWSALAGSTQRFTRAMTAAIKP